MNLKTFIKESIEQIAAAVNEINENENKPAGLIVNPKNLDIQTKDSLREGRIIEKGVCYRKVEFLDFDIALQVSDSGKGEGKLGISVASLSGKVDHTKSSESRIKFSIPVMLPGKIVVGEEYRTFPRHNA